MAEADGPDPLSDTQPWPAPASVAPPAPVRAGAKAIAVLSGILARCDPRGWNPARRRRAAVLTAAAAVLLVLPLAAWSRCGWRGCPSVQRLAAYRPGGAPQLLDSKGRVFASLAPVEGQVVPLRTIPAHVRHAFLAVEDQRFYDHDGVDWRRVWGALLANLRSRGYEQGFSTITMQLARNVFPERIPARERTLARKLLEVRVAQAIERSFTKDQILELYLNHVYFGSGARGIEAAARHYFGVSAGALEVSQAALLAGVLKGPSLYDPRRHPERAKERRDLVLSLMAGQGRIDEAAAAAARRAPLGVVRRSRAGRPDDGPAPYFAEQVRREMEDRFGEELYDEALRIHTTLDLDVQRAAEEELQRQLRAIEQGAAGRLRGPKYAVHGVATEDATPYLQGAVVALSAATGDVLAWVGGRDFLHSRFDRVNASRRQTGSAFKPFVYAAALASGRALSEHVRDEPIQIRLDRRRVWEPRNFGEEYDGEVTVRDALVRSKNVPTVELATGVGLEAVAETARRAGIVSPMDVTPSLALGTVAVSPLELAAAYTPFATLGDRVSPRLVLKVERPGGEVLWEAPPPQPRRVLSPAVAFLVTDVLRDALVRGTGTAALTAGGWNGPAAGKTGTTNDGTDAWFVGYTPEIVAAVWIGFDEPRTIAASATGGRLAAPVWGRMMARVYRDRPLPAPWKPPSGVVRALVDTSSGLLLDEDCAWGESFREYFLRGTLPRTTCPEAWPWQMARRWPGGEGEDDVEEAEEEAQEDLDREARRRRKQELKARREAEEAMERAQRELRDALREWRRRARRDRDRGDE